MASCKSTDSFLTPPFFELGKRLGEIRLAHNLTQAGLAEQAGVSKRTVGRLESGAVATHLSSLIRACRVLGLIDRLDMLIPEPLPSPIEQLKLQGRKRKRASGRKPNTRPNTEWKWGDEA